MILHVMAATGIDEPRPSRTTETQGDPALSLACVAGNSGEFAHQVEEGGELETNPVLILKRRDAFL